MSRERLPNRHAAESFELQASALRTASEQESIKWSRMSKRQRALQVAAAHKTNNGRKASLAERIKYANTMEARVIKQSKYEIRLQRMLRKRGLRNPFRCPCLEAPDFSACLRNRAMELRLYSQRRRPRAARSRRRRSRTTHGRSDEPAGDSSDGPGAANQSTEAST
jgi:hypothetical protein